MNTSQQFLTVFTGLCNHHHKAISAHFNHPQETLYPLAVTLCFRHPRALTITNLCLYELAYFEYFIKCNHTIYGLLWLASFTQHVFKFHLFKKLPNNSFNVQIYHILFIHSSVDGNVSCFHFEVTMSNTAMDIYVILYRCMFLTLLSIYETAEMLDQMVILHLIFKKLANFSKAVACFTSPPGRNCL